MSLLSIMQGRRNAGRHGHAGRMTRSISAKDTREPHHDHPHRLRPEFHLAAPGVVKAMPEQATPRTSGHETQLPQRPGPLTCSGRSSRHLKLEDLRVRLTLADAQDPVRGRGTVAGRCVPLRARGGRMADDSKTQLCRPRRCR